MSHAVTAATRTGARAPTRRKCTFVGDLQDTGGEAEAAFHRQGPGQLQAELALDELRDIERLEGL